MVRSTFTIYTDQCRYVNGWPRSWVGLYAFSHDICYQLDSIPNELVDWVIATVKIYYLRKVQEASCTLISIVFSTRYSLLYTVLRVCWLIWLLGFDV